MFDSGDSDDEKIDYQRKCGQILRCRDPELFGRLIEEVLRYRDPPASVLEALISGLHML